MNPVQPLLHVKNLHTSFFTHDGEVKAVKGVDFHVDEGETLGIVGESGSGKSVTSLSILKLLPSAGAVVDGEILLKGPISSKPTEQNYGRFAVERSQ